MSWAATIWERWHIGGEIRHTAVATTVVWLCSDATANVNGRTLYVGDDEIAYAQPIGPA